MQATFFMKKIQLHHTPKITFVLAVVIIFGVSVNIDLNLQGIIKTTLLVEQSLTIEHKLDETASLLNDAETGPRGFVITGNEVFLMPYYDAFSSKDGIIPHVQELRRLTSNDPHQLQLLNKLEPLVYQKLDFMKKVVETRRNLGFKAAKELIETDIGRQVMIELRQYLTEMHNYESMLLLQRSNDSSTSTQDTMFAMFLGLGSGFSLLLFTIFVVNREVNLRKRAEDELLQLNNELNVRIDTRVEELRKSEEAFRLMVESVNDYAIIMLGPKGTILSWNIGAEVLNGYKDKEIIGEHFSRFFTEPDNRSGKPALLLKTAAENGKVKDEGWRVRKDGTQFWADVVITAIYDDKHLLTGFAKVSHDVTERMKNEQRIVNLSRMYATLAQINETLVRVRDKKSLFQNICSIAVKSGKFGMAWIGKLDLETGIVTPTFVNRAVQNTIPLPIININAPPYNNDIIGSALITGNVTSSKNIQTDPAMKHWRDVAIEGGFQSAASVPIRENGVISGLLTLYAYENDFFIDTEITLLKEIGGDISFSLDSLGLVELQKKTAESLLQSEMHFKEMFEKHSAIMIVIDPVTGFILEANSAATTFYGWSLKEMQQMRIFDINTLPPDKITVAIKQTETGEKNYFIFRHRRADGSIRDVEAYSRTIMTSGKPALYTIIHDISERTHYEITNELHIKLLEMVESHSIEELLQLTLDEAERLTESSIGFFHFVDKDQKNLSLQAWSTNTEKNMCKAVGEGTHYALDSAGVWADAARAGKALIHNDYATIQNRKGMPEGHAEVIREVVVPVLRGNKVVAILGVGNKKSLYDELDVKWVTLVADIAWDIVAKKIGEEDRKILEAQKYAIENLAMHDSLTGLPNRRLLSEQINMTISLCRRNSTMAAVMLLDLDKFKPVNDAYGHEVGDLLLIEVANRALDILQRGSDTLARLGGDEFVVLLPQIEEISQAEAIAEKIRYALVQPFEIQGHHLNISCSIGIAIFPEHGDEEIALIKNADKAMYVSKNNGRNQISVFKESAEY